MSRNLERIVRTIIMDVRLFHFPFISESVLPLHLCVALSRSVHFLFERHGSGGPTPCGGYPGTDCSGLFLVNNEVAPDVVQNDEWSQIHGTDRDDDRPDHYASRRIVTSGHRDRCQKKCKITGDSAEVAGSGLGRIYEAENTK